MLVLYYIDEIGGIITARIHPRQHDNIIYIDDTRQPSSNGVADQDGLGEQVGQLGFQETGGGGGRQNIRF